MVRAKSGPVTVQTIAKHLGVSPAAVSTVLANRQVERRLAQATVEKIQQAVRQFGYLPNIAGRRLQAHDPAVRKVDLGILTSYEAPLFLVSRSLRQVQHLADARTGPNLRFSVSIDMFHAGRLREMPGLLDDIRFNGVIITNTLPADDAFLASTTLPYSVVMHGRSIPNYSCVIETPGDVGRRSAEILLGLGRKHLAVLTPALLTQATADRTDAFCAAVREHTGRDPARVVAGFAPRSAAEAFRAHCATGAACDGLFAVMDALALGAYGAIKERGWRIPDDIAVTGVGDHDDAEYFDPPLSCVGFANDRMLEKGAQLLFDLISRRRVRAVKIVVEPATARRPSA